METKIIGYYIWLLLVISWATAGLTGDIGNNAYSDYIKRHHAKPNSVGESTFHHQLKHDSTRHRRSIVPEESVLPIGKENKDFETPIKEEPVKETKLDPLDMNETTTGKKRRKMRRKKKKNPLGDLGETAGLSENVAPETLPELNPEASKDLKEDTMKVELTTPAKKRRKMKRKKKKKLFGDLAGTTGTPENEAKATSIESNPDTAKETEKEDSEIELTTPGKKRRKMKRKKKKKKLLGDLESTTGSPEKVAPETSIESNPDTAKETEKEDLEIELTTPGKKRRKMRKKKKKKIPLGDVEATTPKPDNAESRASVATTPSSDEVASTEIGMTEKKLKKKRRRKKKKKMTTEDPGVQTTTITPALVETPPPDEQTELSKTDNGPKVLKKLTNMGTKDVKGLSVDSKINGAPPIGDTPVINVLDGTKLKPETSKPIGESVEKDKNVEPDSELDNAGKDIDLGTTSIKTNNLKNPLVLNETPLKTKDIRVPVDIKEKDTDSQSSKEEESLDEIKPKRRKIKKKKKIKTTTESAGAIKTTTPVVLPDYSKVKETPENPTAFKLDMKTEKKPDNPELVDDIPKITEVKSKSTEGESGDLKQKTGVESDKDAAAKSTVTPISRLNGTTAKLIIINPKNITGAVKGFLEGKKEQAEEAPIGVIAGASAGAVVLLVCLFLCLRAVCCGCGKKKDSATDEENEALLQSKKRKRRGYP